jgi:hypothetical protein
VRIKKAVLRVTQYFGKHISEDESVRAASRWTTGYGTGLAKALTIRLGGRMKQ